MRYDPNDNQDGTVPPPPDKQPNEFYFAAWRRAFDFRGVASRLEYWSFSLINSAVVLLLSLGIWAEEGQTAWYFGYAILAFIALTAIPYLSVSVRRFRDVTGTGWFVLLYPLLYTPFIASVLGTLMGASRGGREIVDTSKGYGGVWGKTPDWLSRSDRTEFWMFVLFNTLIYLGSSIVLGVLSTVFEAQDATYGSALASLIFVLILVLFTPLLPLLVRRVRDATGSGWVTPFLFPVTLVSPFLFLVITVSPSRDEEHVSRLSGGYWDVWRKTADFVGVAKRSEYWPFTLINSAILIGGAVLGAALYISQVDRFGNLPPEVQVPVSLLTLLLLVLYLAMSVPWFSLAVRRVRDATGSGWWFLTWLIPFIGWIIVLVLFLLPSRKTPSPDASEEPTPPNNEGDAFEADDPWSTQSPEAAGQQHSES